jgi:hypothetical protein
VNAAASLDRVRHHARRPLARTPYAWDLAMQLRPDKRSTLAGRRSAIVIEGFLRSGNTWSVAAFQVANGVDLPVAHHLHGGAHVRRAVRLGLPTVVLVRRPADAVSSYLVRRPTLTPADALLEYLDFHRTAWPARAGFLVAPFEEAVADFGAVTDRVNVRFGTRFARFGTDPASHAAALALVEEMNRRECGGTVVESHVGRPSEEREHHKARVRQQLSQPRSRALLERADEAFEAYLALASRPLG